MKTRKLVTVKEVTRKSEPGEAQSLELSLGKISCEREDINGMKTQGHKRRGRAN